KVKLITASFGIKSEFNAKHRLYNPDLAGGALLDLGIYPILFSNYIANSYPIEIKSNAEFTKTNVDESNIINLKYKDGILASLNCSLTTKLNNETVIYGENGKIVIPRFWASKEAYLYIEENPEKYIDEYEEAGYKYEIEEANSCIKNNTLESNVASHNNTLELAKIMDEIRRQIGLVYPFE
ncbi:Gfo/Idh/MocA family oxidoreductase, partial [Clostridium sp.]